MKAFKKFVASAAAAAATMTSSSSASATTMEHSATSHAASIEIDATAHNAATTHTNSHTASAPQWTKPTPQLHHHTAATKSKRIHERRQRIQRKLSELPPGAKLHRMTVEELEAASRNASGDDPKFEKAENSWLRRGDLGMDGERIGGLRERDLSRAGGGSSADEERNGDFGRKLWGTSDYDPYTASGLASNVEYYDKWQQAYRMLGGYIDCDFKQGGGGSHDKNNGGGGEDEGACSRWMMWAAVSDIRIVLIDTLSSCHVMFQLVLLCWFDCGLT